MKVLVIYVNEFSYMPAEKNLPDTTIVDEGNRVTDAILAFIHVEEIDEEKDIQSREKKLVNHLKWTLRKNKTNKVVLHSFAHLSTSKASVEYSMKLFNAAEKRLKDAGIEAIQTPFGYFLDLNIHAPGYSLARIWAEL